LLPLLPESTIFYAAFPNYATVAQQALQVFRRERQESAVLRNWWQHGEIARSGPKVEDALEEFYQCSQIFGRRNHRLWRSQWHAPPNIAIIAEVRKPGFKDFLERTPAAARRRREENKRARNSSLLPLPSQATQEEEVSVRLPTACFVTKSAVPWTCQ
jgi:hypothetical protein